MKIKANTAYLCRTLEDAEAFLKECDNQNITWCTNLKVTSEINWNTYKSETCYCVESDNDGDLSLRYGDISSVVSQFPNMEIITYVCDPETAEEAAARDLAWKQLMQLREPTK